MIKPAPLSHCEPLHTGSLDSPAPPRFMGWRDLVITPLVELGILAAAAAPTWLLAQHFRFGLVDSVFVFYLAQLVIATAAVRLLCALWPMRDGVHLSGSVQSYLFHLVGFISALNLHAFVGTSACPVFLRQIVYQCLGTRFGGGITIIGGRLMDPWLVSIGRGAIVGDDVVVLGHAITMLSAREDAVIIGRVEIGEGALVGARSIVMPGARIGAHSLVQAMSLVPMGARVPPYEIWGGCPAKKVGDVRR